MNVFLSYSIAEADGPIASRARALAAVHDLRLNIADRRPGVHAMPDADRRNIRKADAVIAVLGRNGLYRAQVLKEVAVAKAAGKPVLTLVEDGEANLPNAVHLDRGDPGLTEEAISKAIHAMLSAENLKDTRNILQVVASALVILLVLTLLPNTSKS